MSSIAAMNILNLFKELVLQLQSIYDEQESTNIAALIFEKITGVRNAEKINPTKKLNSIHLDQLQNFTSQLLKNKPVQYVINESWFDGIQLVLNESVLIPRPETEELVDWIKKSYSKNAVLQIIEIGTGSGCIALALKKHFTNASIIAIDISEKALQVAQENASIQKLEIQFLQIDFLKGFELKKQFNIIVSNPPYIKLCEQNSILPHILQYEPHEALFVQDDNALIFYEKIALFGKDYLMKDGNIFVELNEALAFETKLLFENYHYKNVEIKKDMQEKNRMLKASY